MPPTLLPTEVDGLKSQLYGINGTTIGNRHDYRVCNSSVNFFFFSSLPLLSST